MWTAEDNPLVSEVRAALANEQGTCGPFGFSLQVPVGQSGRLTKNQLYKQRVQREKAVRAQVLQPASARCIGLFQDANPAKAGCLTVSVVDFCRDGAGHLDSKGRIGDDEEAKLRSSQGALVVLDLRELVQAVDGDQGIRLGRTVEVILACLQRGVPFVLLLCDYDNDGGEGLGHVDAASVSEVSLSEVRSLVDDVVSEGRQRGSITGPHVLKTALRSLFSLFKGQGYQGTLRGLGDLYLSRIRLMMIISSEGVLKGQTASGPKDRVIRSAVQYSLEVLAAASSAFPIIQRYSSGDWMCQELLQYRTDGPDPTHEPTSLHLSCSQDTSLRNLQGRVSRVLSALIPQMNSELSERLLLLSGRATGQQQTTLTFPSPIYCTSSYQKNNSDEATEGIVSQPFVWNAILDSSESDNLSQSWTDGRVLPQDWIARTVKTASRMASAEARIRLPSWPLDQDDGENQDGFTLLLDRYHHQLTSILAPSEEMHSYPVTARFSAIISDWICTLALDGRQRRDEQRMSSHLRSVLAQLVKERIEICCPRELRDLYLQANTPLGRRGPCIQPSRSISNGTPLLLPGLTGLGPSPALQLSSARGLWSGSKRLWPEVGAGAGAAVRLSFGEKLPVSEDDISRGGAVSSGSELDRDQLTKRPRQFLESDRKEIGSASPLSLSSISTTNPVEKKQKEELQLSINKEMAKEKELEEFLAKVIKAGQFMSLSVNQVSVPQGIREQEGEALLDPMKFIQLCREERFNFERKLK